MTLQNSGRIYTSQVYLVLRDVSRMEDVNTLIDGDQDPAILTDLGRAPAGVGKWAVEQVVLSHGHSGHCALLPRICEEYHPMALAFSASIAGVVAGLHDGDTIRMGDADFKIVHTPGDSSHITSPGDVTRH
jgi:glyoxylase-like metal-dependent hydrolase (beta-lactamase superfamily II)